MATEASSEVFRLTYEATGCHNQEERAMAHAVSGRPLVGDTRVLFSFNLFEVCSSKPGSVIQVSILVPLLFPVGIISRTLHNYLYFSSIDSCILQETNLSHTSQVPAFAVMLLSTLGSWKYKIVVTSNIISSNSYFNKIHAVIFKWNARTERDAGKIIFVLILCPRVGNDGHQYYIRKW